MSTWISMCVSALCIVTILSSRGNGCLDGFPTLNEVTSFSCSPGSSCFEGPNNARQLRLFPTMTITCDGVLQNLTVAGQFDDMRDPYPELQIWRPSGNPNTYSKVTNSTFTFPVDCSSFSSTSQQCTLGSPISVKANDVIGILLPRNQQNQFAFGIFFSNGDPAADNYVLDSIFETTYTLGSPTGMNQPMIFLGIMEGTLPYSTTIKDFKWLWSDNPTTTMAMTPRPPTTQPITTQPTTQSGTTQPTTQPGTTQPTTQPGTTQPTTQPGTTQPTTQPGTTQPTTQPGTTQPTTQPGTTQPTTQPGTTQPTTQPGTTQPTTQPGTTQPVTSQPATTDPNSTTSEPATTRSTAVVGGQNSLGVAAGAAVGGIIAVLLAVLIVVIIVVFIVWSRKSQSGSNFDNLNYENGSTITMKANAPLPPVLHNATYDYSAASTAMDANDYDHFAETHMNPSAKTYYSSLEEPTSNALTKPTHYPESTSYEQPVTTLQKGLPIPQEWGLVVPSLEQRSKALSLKSQSTVSSRDDELYAVIGMSQYSSSGPAPKFFEECETYWEPSSIANELYEQLACRKYREILRPHIQITSFLGSGAFGTVSKGLWQSPGGAMEVAIKTIQGKDKDEKVKFLQEAAIMGQFRHPNVVKLMGVVTVGEPVMIVLELLANGDLRDFLIKMRPEPGEMVPTGTPKLLLKFCQQISCGMEYLARKAFVHRDLAARNILVSEEKTCKISDFGMSRDLMDENYYVSHGGKIPVKWTALEAIHFKKYSTASDMWSFGCVMYEIWSLGHKPFEAFDNVQTIKKLDKGVRLPPPPGCPRELYKLMIECWNPEYSRRPSFAQLVEMLSQADFELLLWREEDTNVGPQVSVVGGPLDASKNLYSDLQSVYQQQPDNEA